MQHLPAHLGSNFQPEEIRAGLISISAGLAVAVLVHRFAHRTPWPRPFRLAFVLLHLGAALAAGLIWAFLSSVIQSLFTSSPALAVFERRWNEFVFLGGFFYGIIAGISYAVDATARAARAEAAAARTQLAALRAQLHPHFLFNALHTVVQLIPVDPARAAEAAQLVASLLRATVEEERDEVTLGDEWEFVSKYLTMERIRFGDRLRVRAEVDPDLLGERVPSFALQTLVENAVRHGVAHRVEPTDVVVTASASKPDLTLVVRNSGDGVPVRPSEGGGTGLARLRERLAVLYGGAASLTCGTTADGGFDAVLVVPLQRGRRS
jgi:two-component system LytT family sensor kinase